MIRVEFVKTHELAKIPDKNNKSEVDGLLSGDSGYDLFSVENIVIPPTKVLSKVDNGIIPMVNEDFECSDHAEVGSAIVPVGLQLAYIEPGYWFRIEARSGLGFKYGVHPHFGIIDNQYRGDLGVKLYNLTGKPYNVSVGDKIAQIIFYPILEADFYLVDKVKESKRGAKGLGSSGK
jgi:deoxyuridine 5'-triphosphate nucleotidohydrolase